MVVRRGVSPNPDEDSVVLAADAEVADSPGSLRRDVAPLPVFVKAERQPYSRFAHHRMDVCPNPKHDSVLRLRHGSAPVEMISRNACVGHSDSHPATARSVVPSIEPARNHHHQRLHSHRPPRGPNCVLAVSPRCERGDGQHGQKNREAGPGAGQQPMH